LGIGGGGGGGGGGFMSARGAANALTKTTTILAAGFFATSIALGVISQGESRTGNVIEQLGNQNGVPTGEGTDAGTAAPSAGNLLEDLEREGQPVAPTTSVPTSE
jgi:preprotein translocase subunit SecG